PYGIAAALVRRLVAPGSAMRSAHLVLPRWQVNRWLADPPRHCHVAVGLHVPAAAFRPPPRSDSAVLVLHPRRRAESSRRGRARLCPAGGCQRGSAPHGPTTPRRTSRQHPNTSNPMPTPMVAPFPLSTMSVTSHARPSRDTVCCSSSIMTENPISATNPGTVHHSPRRYWLSVHISRIPDGTNASVLRKRCPPGRIQKPSGAGPS